MIRYLYFGDVFAKPGRDAVRYSLDRFQKEYRPDVMIANVENVAHGKGVTPKLADEFFSWGFDVLTTGNHAWDQNEIYEYFRNEPRILRPLNYADKTGELVPGQGSVIVRPKTKPNLEVAVILLMGRVFMDGLECPFHVADEELKTLEQNGIKNIFIDFHAEASSEKYAFSYYMDGRASAVIGSHQHVQTADERILPKGTAAITDVGMCGCFDSVIGVKKENAIRKFRSKLPVKFEPAEGLGGYCAVIVEVDENTGRAQRIVRFRESL